MNDLILIMAAIWWVPLHLVIAISSESIARYKGLASGDWFVKSLLFGYVELAQVGAATAVDEQHDVFNKSFARALFEFVLITCGALYFVLVVAGVAYFLPAKFGTGILCLAAMELTAWFVYALFAVPIATLKIVRRLNYKVTRSVRAAAMFGQVFTLIYYIGHLREVEDGLTEPESRLIRSLLIPLAVPVAFVEICVAIVLLLLTIGAITVSVSGRFIDLTFALMCLCAFVALVTSFLLSPAVAYKLAQEKERQTETWVPFSFVVPVIGPLVLSLLPGQQKVRNGDAFLADASAIVITYALTATGLALFALAALGMDLGNGKHWLVHSGFLGFQFAYLIVAPLVPLIGVAYFLRRRRVAGENDGLFYLSVLQTCGIAMFAGLGLVKYILHDWRL